MYPNIAFLYLLSACSAPFGNDVRTQPPKQPIPALSESDRLTDTQAKKVSTIKNTSSTQPIEQLLKKVRSATPEDEKKARDSLEFANRFVREGDRLLQEGKAKTIAEQDQWGMAAKSYGTAVQYKPSVEALLGYAKSDVMVDTIRQTKEQSIAAKIPVLKRAVNNYRLAIALAERTNKPLPAQQRQEIEQNIFCIEAFISNQKPEKVNCQLLKDAFKISQIQ